MWKVVLMLLAQVIVVGGLLGTGIFFALRNNKD